MQKYTPSEVDLPIKGGMSVSLCTVAEQSITIITYQGMRTLNKQHVTMTSCFIHILTV